MRRSQSWLTTALFFAALLVIVLFWTALASSFLGFLYRNAAGLSPVRSITQNRHYPGCDLSLRNCNHPCDSHCVPIWHTIAKSSACYSALFPSLTFVGAIANLIGIGTTGSLVNLGDGVMLNFSSGWVAAGLILSTITVTIAVARTPLAQNIVTNATRLATVTGCARGNRGNRVGCQCRHRIRQPT